MRVLPQDTLREPISATQCPADRCSDITNRSSKWAHSEMRSATKASVVPVQRTIICPIGNPVQPRYQVSQVPVLLLSETVVVSPYQPAPHPDARQEAGFSDCSSGLIFGQIVRTPPYQPTLSAVFRIWRGRQPQPHKQETPAVPPSTAASTAFSSPANSPRTSAADAVSGSAHAAVCTTSGSLSRGKKDARSPRTSAE